MDEREKRERPEDSNILNLIFSNVVYSEISPLFDTMDEMFMSLTKGFELDIVEGRYDGLLEQDLVAKFSEWDKFIEKRIDEWNTFLAVSHNVYGVIDASINRNQNDFDRMQRAYDGLWPLRRWLIETPPTYSFLWMLYYSQRMTQLRRLIELYQKNAPKEVTTWRHLFEEGLKRERVHPEDYLELVYSISESENYKKFDLQFFSLKKWTRGKGRIPIEHIHWESNERKAEEIEHKLAVRLKYAELAYKEEHYKGHIKEVLDPYQLNYAMDGGQNIKGFFKLQGDFNGFVGSRRTKDYTIVVGFRGTKSWANWKTDIMQFIGFMDPVYEEALGVLNSVWMGKSHKKGFENSKIEVCGHSLGGGLMQFAVAKMKKEDISGFGYNSAGLSFKNMERINDYDTPGNYEIYHLYLPNDFVFKIPTTYQLGKAVALSDCEKNVCKAHKMEYMRAHMKECRHDFAVMAI